MPFVSLSTGLFVLAVLAVFQLSPPRLRAVVLLVASYAFYLAWSPQGAIWLLAVSAVAYLAALAVERPRAGARQALVALSAVACLLTVLLGFKLADALRAHLGAGGGKTGGDGLVAALLPLGMSYYVFKLVGYLLDVYWGRRPAVHSFAALALYASFFPQIVAGPIERPDDFFAQVERLELDPEGIAAGLRRILFGFFKKFAIADRLAVLVGAAHADPATHSALELFIAADLFALQMYADFSGFTDIAIGLGQLFGVKGPENFQLPFFARSLPEFWRRWHMSLTSWLTDYLFTPLRMALRDFGQAGLALAIMVNMLAIGVWHGLSLTYAAFGLFNGLALAASALTLSRRTAFYRTRPRLSKVRAVLAPVVTFHLFAASLILFRANSMASALGYFAHLVPARGAVPAFRHDWGQLGGLAPRSLLVILLTAVVMEAIHWARGEPRAVERFLTLPRALRWGAYYAAVIATLALGEVGAHAFIYAQF